MLSALRRWRQVDFNEFETSLVYIVSFRPVKDSKPENFADLQMGEGKVVR